MQNDYLWEEIRVRLQSLRGGFLKSSTEFSRLLGHMVLSVGSSVLLTMCAGIPRSTSLLSSASPSLLS